MLKKIKNEKILFDGIDYINYLMIEYKSKEKLMKDNY